MKLTPESKPLLTKDERNAIRIYIDTSLCLHPNVPDATIGRLLDDLDALTAELAAAREREKAVDNQMRTLMATRNELMQAVEAAAYRKAAELANLDRYDTRQHIHDAVLALISPSAQSALDSMLAELKAQTAAMLEKAGSKVIAFGNRSDVRTFESLATDIRALIPTDYAAALAERVQQAALAAQLEHMEYIHAYLVQLLKVKTLDTATIEKVDEDLYSHWCALKAPARLASLRAACGTPFTEDVQGEYKK